MFDLCSSPKAGGLRRSSKSIAWRDAHRLASSRLDRFMGRRGSARLAPLYRCLLRHHEHPAWVRRAGCSGQRRAPGDARGGAARIDRPLGHAAQRCSAGHSARGARDRLLGDVVCADDRAHVLRSRLGRGAVDDLSLLGPRLHLAELSGTDPLRPDRGDLLRHPRRAGGGPGHDRSGTPAQPLPRA